MPNILPSCDFSAIFVATPGPWAREHSVTKLAMHSNEAEPRVGFSWQPRPVFEYAPAMVKKGWRDGIRFECQGSGKCCLSRGTHGYVYLTLKDRRQLARKLQLTTSAFTRRYCVTEDGWVRLKQPPGEACRFLDKKRCTVYSARPTQCRTWPFWPENMGAKAWDREVTKFCPGVGKGRFYSEAEISALLLQDPLRE